jgi:CPA2 family monovalent cation:H+ antiporter-2
LIGWLLVDLLIMAGIAVGASLASPHAIRMAQSKAGLLPVWAHRGIIAVTILLLVPFVIGAIRMSLALAAVLATEALPANQGALDLAAAPRRALLVTLQIGILLIGGGPLVAVVQPFYPSLPGVAVLLGLLLLLAYPLWRSAANVQGHARAGAQVILEALAAQRHDDHDRTRSEAPAGDALSALVPGLGDTALVTLDAGSPAVGHSLAELGLRGRSGATVVAIQRGAGEVIYPRAEDILGDGDILVLAGSAESVELARGVLSLPAQAKV